MNLQEKDILINLLENPFTNQRNLAANCGHSLGIVNRSLKNLQTEGYITEGCALTDKAEEEFKSSAPESAVILAAGYGMKIAAMNEEIPKGLLEVKGEVLIERLIKQLHEAGIRKIYVIVGFMKENYEYLIDDFGVELLVSTEYAKKNNLHSVKLAADRLTNTYILPCDLYCLDNPFSKHELYSWYMVSDAEDEHSSVRVNRKMELVSADELSIGNAMIGISYLMGEDAENVKRRIAELTLDKRYDGSYWEEALYNKDRMIIPAKVVRHENVIEINTYEQYCEATGAAKQKTEQGFQEAADYLGCSVSDMKEVKLLKKGITNHTYRFCFDGEDYVLRIPQEDNMLLLNREREEKVYELIGQEKIGDHVLCLHPKTGVKISCYMKNARPCDAYNENDVKVCMQTLRAFHDRHLEAEYSMDLFVQIEKYESLWERSSSAYRDYKKTKEAVFSLKDYIDQHANPSSLCHLDLSEDNFLLFDEDGTKAVLIDWEYAAMQDPLVDLAMFAIRSYYDKEQIDRLIDGYFTEGCKEETRILIYCYISVCALMWSNWCEYKRNKGVDFGEYSLKQYRYAKEYCRIVKESLTQ